ncbi:hypothetical protein EDD37DRAFT_650345 [Exophiala viscosa]|uniref:Uncharacterized protein n=1 Tax=Exophiala viscosa TaxID=2486360 RepID=A0AAN6DQJ4_9EURO|nr:hypothetical protein EDD36DRAFT_466747 [Exophiala viscosa]KAI1624470.1 hypothetical protein EDD37DRAFT_650345 [Exophiala viscosa]
MSHPQPPPQSSIPGYRPTPFLSRGKKFLLVSIFVVPIASYAWLKRLEARSREQTRLLEEEGRRNWIRENQKFTRRDLSVAVGRSGGGV